MIVSEKEAATMWCPMVRGVTAERDKNEQLLMPRGSVPVNVVTVQSGEQLNQGRCIGRKCMAWRRNSAYVTGEGDTVGYCGAFGKVEP